VLEERGEGGAHATCEPRRTEAPTHQRGGRSMSAGVRSPGGVATGDGVDRPGGGAGRQQRAEWTEKKMEKGSEVGGRRLLKVLSA
jgi:hypothetical protein